MDLLDRLRDATPDAFDGEPVLFGSRTTGRARSGSDVDAAVMLDDDLDRFRRAIAEVVAREGEPA